MKYKIGDEIFFLKHSKIVEEKIEGVRRSYTKMLGDGYGSDFCSVSYLVGKHPSFAWGDVWIDEDKIFSTREDLIKSL